MFKTKGWYWVPFKGTQYVFVALWNLRLRVLCHDPLLSLEQECTQMLCK